MRCVECGAPAELHHWKTRKSGGTDDTWNLMPLCRNEHTEVHKIGSTTFAAKYKKVTDWLIANGWDFDSFKKKWTHYAK